MGELEVYFFDTYAFWELIEGNPDYDKFTKRVIILTTKLNLMELHYGLLMKYGKQDADRIYDELSPYAIEFDSGIIKKANEFRASMKGHNLSYVDCIGYTIAQLRGVDFLTGDKEFENLPGVEYVK